MVTGNWMNNDGLFVQYGTSKAVPTVTGDYLSYGDVREIELTVTLASLATTPTIIGNTTFFPSNVFVESVTVDTEIGMTVGSATSISIGTMRTDRTTVGTGGTASGSFLASAVNADFTTAGQRKDYVGGTATVGTAVGTTTSFTDGGVYITAQSNAGTYTGGVIKLRIRYRGIGTITQ